MKPTSTSPATPRRTLPSWLPWAVPSALLAAWVVHVLRNYAIRAFSDPLNWLQFASHFGTEIQTSKFALGFPVFLRAALELAGPYCIFLVNLPVLLAVYLMAAALAVRAFGPEERIPRWQVVTLTLSLFFTFDSGLVVQMMNPFRDPLSFLLALGAAVLLARHAVTGGARPAQVLGSGLLLGLACTVRETSVLLLAPFALYAFWSWRADPRIRFWRDALLFAAGFAAGLAPLMFQGLFTTGQVLLPPQAAVEKTLVPGAHFTWMCLRGTLKTAWPYFLRMAGPGLLLLVWSAVLGVWRRNRIVAGLLLPAALVHAAFYSFYWTFVPRYFYSVAIFAVPVAAWGLLATIRGMVARAPLHIRTAMPAVAVGAAALAAAVHLLSIRPEVPPFQIPQARQFAADFERLLPADSLVFSRRHLCEMVRWFTPARSFPATSLIPADVPAEAALREALPPYLSDPRPLYLLEMRSGASWEADAALLDRICGLDFVGSFPAERYHLDSPKASSELRLFRVKPWLPSPQILPGADQARNGVARLDFALHAAPIASAALVGDTVPPTLGRNTPRIRGSAIVALPGPVGTGESAIAEFRVLGPKRASGTQEIKASIGDSSGIFQLPQDRAWHVFTIRAEGPMENPALELRSPSPFDLHRVDWSISRSTARLEIDIGAEGDFTCLREGWHDRETTTGEKDARWTEPTATLAWRCAAPGDPARIALRHFARNRPADAAPPRLWCNDVELSADTLPNDETGEATVTAEIPAGILKPENIIRIETADWKHEGDHRALGIFVDWILLSAEPAEKTQETP